MFMRNAGIKAGWGVEVGNATGSDGGRPVQVRVSFFFVTRIQFTNETKSSARKRLTMLLQPIREFVPHAASCILNGTHLILLKGKSPRSSAATFIHDASPPPSPHAQHGICQQYLNQPSNDHARLPAAAPSRDLVRSCWRQFFFGHLVSTPALLYVLLYPVAR